jgi:hypothetical protein
MTWPLDAENFGSHFVRGWQRKASSRRPPIPAPVHPWEPSGSHPPAALGPLLAAVFGPAPSKRRVMLRGGPRTCRLPPAGRPACGGWCVTQRDRGVPPPRSAGMAYGLCPHRQRTARRKLKSVGSSGVIAVVALPCSKAPKSRQTFRNQPKAGG